MKQIVLVVLIAGALELPLSFWERRILECTSDPTVFVTYTGLPFEAIKIKNTITPEPGATWYRSYPGGPKYPGDYQQTQKHQQQNERTQHPLNPEILSVVSLSKSYECLWNGIILNTILFITFSIIMVKLSSRIHDEIEYRKWRARELSMHANRRPSVLQIIRAHVSLSRAGPLGEPT